MSAANGRSRISAKEFVAATGVILSLVFVGLEIRQNTLAVRSSTLQALSDAHRDLVLESLLSQEHSALISRTFLGETSDSGGALNFHATPESVGQIAANAEVEQLILSHLFVGDLEEGVAEVRTRYDGVVRVGEDLACYPLG